MARGSDGEKRILEAAEDLFSRHGFDATSIQKIATKASVSKATIFHHFSNKQELYITVLKQACLDIGTILQSLEKEPCTSVKPLRDFASAHLKNMFDQKEVSRLILREMTDGDVKRGQALAVEVFGEHFSRLVVLIQGGQEEGVLRKDMDAADAAAAIVGLNVFMFQSWSVLQHLPGTSFTDPAHTGERWLRLLLLGITDRKEATA
ncbi:MAG: TetR/AcrR family transcriptional regulator [Mariprofundaceae bacterium]|nr:TetR/AcrR family transcriptional regulator [Mariprofundaceae bacterium]